MRVSILIVISLFLITASSCMQEIEPVSPELPPTPILTSDSRWGVTNKPYQKILSDHRGNAEVNGLLRRGDIVEILSKVGENDSSSYWMEVVSLNTETRGWVPDNSLNVYDSPAQARTARAGLDSGN